MSVRLNKLLAQRGIGARRKCDALIEAGAVRVNGEVVREPGTRVEPERDRVEVEGRRLPQAPELRYFALNKPVGVIWTIPKAGARCASSCPPAPACSRSGASTPTPAGFSSSRTTASWRTASCIRVTAWRSITACAWIASRRRENSACSSAAWSSSRAS